MKKETYVIMLRPAPAYGEEGTGEIVNAHLAHLQKLHETGEVQMAGRFSDVLIGLVLVNVDSELHAREIMNNDPAVKAGVFHAELYKWSIALQ